MTKEVPKKCGRCEAEADYRLDDGMPVCARHYVELEEKGCLEAIYLSMPNYDRDILLEIEKQYPDLVEMYADVFQHFHKEELRRSKAKQARAKQARPR